MKKLLQWLLIPVIVLVGTNKISACHGSPLLNYVVTINATNITINANSDPATCGCGPYYIEVQLSCNPTFTGTAPICASPTWNTFPWYHALLNVPGYSAPAWTDNCILEPYSPVVVPFSGLCPGQQYWVRSREMVCGSLSAGAWSTVNTFIVPGAGAPVLSINASTLTVCPPGCANLTSNIVGGCPTSWAYSWTGGLGTAANAVACPAVTTTYTLTATPVCGLPLTQVITINVSLPAVAGVANISAPSICAGQTVSLSLVGSSGTIQWQSAPTAGGPWTNIGGATASTYTSGPLATNRCFRATVTGCTIVNSNIVCVIVNPIPVVTINPIIPICVGQSISLTANGAATYSWLPGGQITQVINVTPLVNTTYTVIGTTAGCTGSAVTTVVVNPLPVVSAGPDIVSCTAPVQLSSTLGFIQYSWAGPVSNPTISNPTAATSGSYIVTVLNANGCIASDGVSVTITPAPPINVTITNPLCFGGVGSATATSGFTTYLWSSSGNTTNIESGLTIGNYSVTGTMSTGCTSTTNFVITQPTQVVATTSMTPTTCGLPNGSATANPSGGVGPYTYLWSNAQTSQTISNILFGIYTCTVTDANGCQIVVNINVTNTGAPTVTIPIKANVLCFGGNNGSANSLVVGGVGPFTYTWNTTPIQNTPNATNLTAGNYTLTVTGSNGCSSTATVNITQPTTLTATSVQTNVSCFGGNNGVAIVNPVGGVPPYTYLWSNAQVTQTATTLVAGSYTCTVTDANGCTTSVVVNITQPPTLSISMISNSVSCFGGNNGSASVVVLGGTPAYTYTWNTTPVQNTSTANNLIAGNYTVTVTDTRGCQITSSVIISQPTQVVVTTSMVPTTCGLPNGSATANPSGGSGTYTYLWSNAQTSQTINSILSGVYTCTITDTNGCVTIGSVTVTNTGAPIVTIPTTVNVSCFGGNNGSANSLVVGGVPPYTYLWSNGQTTSNASNLPAGNYTLTVTGNNGCSASATIIITQPTQLTAAITTTNVSCFGGNNGSSIATPVGGVGPYTYSWNSIPIQNTQTASNLPLGVYTCTITDFNGCQITAAANITQPTQLTLTTTSSINILCNGGANGSITVAASGGVGPNYLYSLNAGPNQLSPTFTGLTAGVYTVVVTDQNGCTSSVNITLTEPVILTMNANIMDVTCFNACDGFLLSNVFGGVGPYTYLYSNGNTSNPANGLCAGSYSVLVTDVNGCQTGMTGLTISQPNLLVVSPTASPISICIGQTSILNSNPVGGTAPYTYTWSSGATTQNTSVSPVITTNYTIDINDANGCTSTANVIVTVNPPLTGSASSIPSTICAGQTSIISATANGGTGGPYTFNWIPGGSGQNLTVTPNATTIYTVTISDGCSPSITRTTTVIVNPLPTVMISTTPLSGCEPLTVTYTNLTANSSTCLWSINGVPYNNCIVTHTFSVGTHISYLTVTDVNGCSATSPSIVANVYPNPVASFVLDPHTTDILSPIITFTNLSTPGSYSWNFGDNNTSSIVSPTHIYGDTGTYLIQLIVTTQYGCVDMAYATVHIDDIFAVYVPNAFTPNGDGRNDTFYPVVTGAEKYTFWIFDRWGEMIYTSDNGTPWDSTYKGPQVQDGVYVWKLIAIDKRKVRHEYVGHVTLIK